MKSIVLLLQARLLLLLLLLVQESCQASTCDYGSDTLQVGEVAYEFVSQNGIDMCTVANCTGTPFPQVSTKDQACSSIDTNCSVQFTPHQKNLALCCKECSECDFLACPKFSTCEESNLNGAQCQCLDGYAEMMSDGELTCVDVNECTSNESPCPSNSDCVNTPGEFSCLCHPGYSGSSCTDIDECAVDPNICPESTQCKNHDGFYECVCNDQCSLDINSYYLTTPSEPEDVFAQNPDCLQDLDNFPDQNIVACTGQQVLTDNSAEASIPPLSSQYVGWDRSQGGLDGFTIIIDAEHTRLTQLDIHFYHHPSAGIGLPEVSSIYVSSSKVDETDVGPLSFTYARNEHLTQMDDRITMVSIIITDVDSYPFYRFVRINFKYSSSLIWSTQLTEIQGYGGTGSFPVENEITFVTGTDNQVIHVEVDDVISEVDLSCTVENPGHFLWEWTRASDSAVLSSSMNLGDLTRTSVLTVSNLSMEASGEYICKAYHSNMSLALEGIATITLELANEVIKKGPTEPIHGSQVTLSCEFVGYYPKGGDTVKWDFEGMTLSQDGGKYNVRTIDGSRGQSQSGGISPGPSLFSSLTVSALEDKDFGTYGCRVMGNYSCTQLIGYVQVTTGSVQCQPSSGELLECPSAVPSSCPSATSSESFLNNVVWFYLFIMETIIIVVMLLVICIVITYYKHHSGTGGYTTPFPNLSRPNKDENNGTDFPDGTDEKFHEKWKHGVDWASMSESKV